MAKQNVYIGFNGRCREALNLYQSILGGESTFLTVGDVPVPCNEGGSKDSIMHGCLISEGSRIMGTDMTGPEGYTPGNHIALCLDCDSQEEIERLFGKLSEGGQVREPLMDAFWGGVFGALTDKFGIQWLFNYTKPQG